MTFCPEWVTGSLNLDASKVRDFWVYVVVRAVSVLQWGASRLNDLSLVYE